ncbi:hypothetical protein BJV38_004880 [Clostridium beijerinckii]|nr:hypothetical protein [Clostridium beijerinckii]NRZ23666.1 hypothetical protein [Clostridium beijerinckii]
MKEYTADITMNFYQTLLQSHRRFILVDEDEPFPF